MPVQNQLQEGAGRLVLGRKAGQRIVIEGGIVIDVLRTSDGSCKLGVLAPGRRILRGELEAFETWPAEEPPASQVA